MSEFPRGYLSRIFNVRMIIDEDVPRMALKDFLGRAIDEFNQQHKGLKVKDLNEVLIELTDDYEDSDDG